MNRKQKTLDYLKNTYARLLPSKISGVGVFAIRDIPKDVKVFWGQANPAWYTFHVDDLKGLDPAIWKMIDDFFVIEKDKTLTIPATGFNGMDMSFYVNHSKKPNLKTTDDGFTFVSNRAIKKGEELTIDYSTYDETYKK